MVMIGNRQVKLTVVPGYGSNLTSLKYNQRELIYTDKNLLENHDFTGCFVLWPFPNRVKNRCYRFNGKKYFLEKVIVLRGNFPLIHGLVRDDVWQYKHTKTKITVWTEINKKHRYWTCFPWHSRLTLSYSLLNRGVKITYWVENLDQSELGFGFGLHPLFKNAVSVKVPARSVMKANDDLLPSGKLLPANLNQLTPVKDLNLDHVFTDLTGPQTVVFPGSLQLKITASKDFTHCVVYTGEKEKYTCVEQQTCSTDAHNLDALGFKKTAHLIRVKPGETKKGWIKYEIS